MSSRVKVVVTGAAGQIAYSLIPRLVDGKTFGNRIVDLCLVEIPQVVSKLEGLVMELEDSYFPHMGEVTYTDNFEEASHDADWFLLVGSIPRGIVYEGKKIEEKRLIREKLNSDFDYNKFLYNEFQDLDLENLNLEAVVIEC